MANNNENDQNVQAALWQQVVPGAEPDPGLPIPPLPVPGGNNGENGENEEEDNNNNNLNNNGVEEENNNDDDDEWPENAPPGPPGPPKAPKPPKKKKFATDLTEAEKAALTSPRPATPPKFNDDVKDRVEDALYSILKRGFDLLAPGKSKDECIDMLRNLMKKHKAILSGGFLLKTILDVSNADWQIPASPTNRNFIRKTKVNTQINSGLDIDFYVNCKELVPFYSVLIPLFQGKEIIAYESSFYCQSFLQKNGIRSVYKCMRPSVAGINELDIMAVRNKRSPLDVITNFDLTVCQVWYDGDSVKATDPEHVIHKVTYLQGDYVPTYLQGNRFLDWRLNKYTQRGFKIVADPSVLLIINPLDVLESSVINKCGQGTDIARVTKKPWSDDFKRKWLVRGLLRYSITGNYHVAGTLKDYSVKRTIPYSADKKSLADILRPMDGYDTDDFVDDIQLLRDRVIGTVDPLKAYALDFLSLFKRSDNKNPFYDVIEEGYETWNRGQKEINLVRNSLDNIFASFSPPPAATGGKRLTRKRR